MQKRWAFRGAVGTAVASAALLAGTAPAWAFHCGVADKPAGAGSKGTVVITPEGEEFTPTGPGKGAFTTIDLTAVGGPVIDVFTVPAADNEAGAIPAVQHLSADKVCDGKGLEDYEACFGEE